MPVDIASVNQTTTAHGRYRLEALLGEGGFARVYRAWDRELMVTRAVKIIAGPEEDRGRMRARLKAEARAMARVGHPNVLRVYDVGADENNDYVVMDLAEAGSLFDQVEKNGPLSPRDAVSYGMQILGALDAAHHAGIIHRDVKPNNVLVDRTGTALLADFGIALVDWDELPRSTRTGTTMGTLAYMAPEQRVNAKNVGPTADIYALGATLYHLVTGATPFDLFMAAPDSPRWELVPTALRDVLLRAVRYEPTERYATAREMAEALSPLLGTDVRMDALPGTVNGPVWSGTLPSPQGTYRAQTLLRQPPVDTVRILEDDAEPTPEPAAVPLAPRRSPWRALAVAAALVAATAAVVIGTTGPRGQGSPSPRTPVPAVAVRPPPAADPPEARPVHDPAPAQVQPARPARVEPASRNRPPRAGASPAAFPLGLWSGTFNGYGMEMSLSGRPEAPSGAVTIRLDDAEQEMLVSGHYDATTRRLVLADRADTPDSGDYSAMVSEDGRSMQGSWDARHRSQRLAFAAKRQ